MYTKTPNEDKKTSHIASRRSQTHACMHVLFIITRNSKRRVDGLIVVYLYNEILYSSENILALHVSAGISQKANITWEKTQVSEGYTLYDIFI